MGMFFSPTAYPFAVDFGGSEVLFSVFHTCLLLFDFDLFRSTKSAICLIHRSGAGQMIRSPKVITHKKSDSLSVKLQVFKTIAYD